MEADEGGDSLGGAAEDGHPFCSGEAGTAARGSPAEKGSVRRGGAKTAGCRGRPSSTGGAEDCEVARGKVSRDLGSKAINARRRAAKKDRRAKAAERGKAAADLDGGRGGAEVHCGAWCIVEVGGRWTGR